MGSPKDLLEPGSQRVPPPLPPRTPRNLEPLFVTEARLPPPLPPRGAPSLPPRASRSPPPEYSEEDPVTSPYLQTSWTSQDTRSASTQSLVPTESVQRGKRTLLLIYIHGFCGNEMSFQSFPAHLHNLLSSRLQDTHAIHTKIYPRYKSRKAIEFARDEFSQWLQPHESSNTDIILLGHSMGGILSAEIVLLPADNATHGGSFRHRILGTINFDVPFLGLHPGVISSGLGSLFNPAPAAQESPETAILSPQLSPYTSISPTDDPNYNPPFPNDVRLPTRSGLENALHFVMKHYSEGLAVAMQNYVMAHLEFGSCLIDYSEMQARYRKIRGLEYIDGRRRSILTGFTQPTPRVRFVNFYTASSGRPKKSESSTEQESQQNSEITEQPLEREMQTMTLGSNESESVEGSSISRDDSQDNAAASVENEEDPSVLDSSGEETELEFEDAVSEQEVEMRVLTPEPEAYSDEEQHILVEEEEGQSSVESSYNNHDPPELDDGLPSVPDEPAQFDATKYESKDELKSAHKENQDAHKQYKKAVKEREKALKQRDKNIQAAVKEQEKAKAAERKAHEKLDKEARKEQEKDIKEARKAEERSQKLIAKAEKKAEKQARKEAEKSKKKDRRFCMLPPKTDDQIDPAWVRIFMEGVDEVGAHCGLFFMGEVYEKLLLETGAKIEEWVNEAQQEGLD